MGYSEFSNGLGNGCDSCSTVPAYGMGLVDTTASQTGLMTTQGYSNQFGSMVSNQVFGQSVAGYAPNGQGAVNMGAGSRYNSNGAKVAPQVAAVAQATQAVAQAVSAAATNAAAQASNNATGEPKPSPYGAMNLDKSSPETIEGFGANYTSMSLHQILAFSFACVLLIASALALNEFMKFVINKSIQNADGTHYYYLLYAGMAVLVGLAIIKYHRNM